MHGLEHGRQVRRWDVEQAIHRECRVHWTWQSRLDWELCARSRPSGVLARRDGRLLWQSYGAVMPVTDGFWRRRNIQRLLWCLEFARPTTSHLTDTATVCAALGIAPVIFT